LLRHFRKEKNVLNTFKVEANVSDDSYNVDKVLQSLGEPPQSEKKGSRNSNSNNKSNGNKNNGPVMNGNGSQNSSNGNNNQKNRRRSNEKQVRRISPIFLSFQVSRFQNTKHFEILTNVLGSSASMIIEYLLRDSITRRPGINFINVLRASFAPVDPESLKRYL
jgi:hypothetical protein